MNTKIADRYDDIIEVIPVSADDIHIRTAIIDNGRETDALYFILDGEGARLLADSIYAALPSKDETADCTGCDGCQKVDPEPYPEGFEEPRRIEFIAGPLVKSVTVTFE